MTTHAFRHPVQWFGPARTGKGTLGFVAAITKCNRCRKYANTVKSPRRHSGLPIPDICHFTSGSHIPKGSLPRMKS
jgi:hypothetical protein